jgi:hypothetical protein
MRWRGLPIAAVLAIAAVMFWGLVTVFGSGGSEEIELPLASAAGSRDLPRIPLAFPEVSKPMVEALPSPEPSPEPPVVASAPKKTATTKAARPVRVPTDGATGNAVTGESGDATIGPSDSTPAAADNTDDPVGDLNFGFENPSTFGPDEPEEEPDPPEEPDEPDDDTGGVSSGNTGNNGDNGSSDSQTDPGSTDGGDND